MMTLALQRTLEEKLGTKNGPLLPSNEELDPTKTAGLDNPNERRSLPPRVVQPTFMVTTPTH